MSDVKLFETGKTILNEDVLEKAVGGTGGGTDFKQKAKEYGFPHLVENTRCFLGCEKDRSLPPQNSLYARVYQPGIYYGVILCLNCYMEYDEISIETGPMQKWDGGSIF